MRTLILAILLSPSGFTQLVAQTMPPMPPTTYPEPGTFCGFLVLCPKDAEPKDDDGHGLRDREH